MNQSMYDQNTNKYVFGNMNTPSQSQQFQQQQQSQPTSPTQLLQPQYFGKQQIADFIDKTFEKKVREWKTWTFSSVFIIFLPLLLFQMLFLSFMFSPPPPTNSTSPSIISVILKTINNHIFGITLYMIGQFILGTSYHSICSVYRQVPASFKEQFTVLSVPHIVFIALNTLIQPLFLYFFFSIPINKFSLSSIVEVCYQDFSETIPIAKCELEYNLFFYLFVISCIGLVCSGLFRIYSNQEFVYSFPKANIPTFLQIKSMLYNNFWISFYTSFYLFFLGSFLLGIFFLILFKTFTIQILIFSIKLWCFTFAIIFQNLTRNRLFEIYFTRGIRFTLENFNSVTFDSPSLSSPPNSQQTLLGINNKPIIENGNIFLLKAIYSCDPLIQALGWKDFLHLSKYSQPRRTHLYREMGELLDDPSILKIIRQYEDQIHDLSLKLSCPKEYYENLNSGNIKKEDEKNNSNSNNNNNNNNNSIIFKIGNNIEKIIKKTLNFISGVKFDYNLYECEIRQALSNTQSILWSIESIGSLIVSAQINDDRETMELLHRYQIPQKFLIPLFQILALIDQLEKDLSHQIELDKFTINRDYYFLKSFSNLIEPPLNCLGVLKTSRPHFRIFKLVGKNIISQVLETIGHQISDISFPYDLRSTLNSYRNGEFSIYQ
ncbi:hypothetical protein ACTFIU_009765 [Dictyostelium citrinum]